MIFRCTYCGREFESEEGLALHSLEAHGTDVQQIDGSDLDVDVENESITEAVLTDYITDVQEAGFGGSEEAESSTGGSPAAQGTAYGESGATSAQSPDVAPAAQPDRVDIAGDPLQEVGESGAEDEAAREGSQGVRQVPTPPPERNREKTLGDLLDPRDEYRCELCGRVFPHREDLDRHRWVQHGPRRAAS